MNMLDNLSALKIFARAAQTLSFTEAGNQLGLSSSAIGKAVARLEQRLGVRLFHRSTRSIQLTDEGQQVLDSCQRIFNELETMEAQVAQSRVVPRGRLRVSLPLAGMLMMPTLTAFMKAFPAIELDLHFSDNLVDIVNDGFDVVIRAGEAADSQLIARSLGNFQLKLVGSPAYFKRAGIPLKPADLADHSCLHHRFPSTGKLERWPLRASLDGEEVVVPVMSIASTIEPLIALAESGLGIVCIPDLACREQLADGRLVEVLADYVEHTGTFRAVWPANPFRSPKLRVFVDFMAKHLLAASAEATPSVSLNVSPIRRTA